MPSAYLMPKVSLGDTVLWKHSRTSVDPAAALVTRVGKHAITVLIFPTDSRGGIPKDGVRHASDPFLDTMIGSDSGVWELTDAAKRLNAVEAILNQPKPAK